MKPALFLDRDGIINVRIMDGYVRNTDEFILLADVLPILRAAHEAGYLLVLITNQQGVGKGIMGQGDLDLVHGHMQVQLAERLGFGLDAMYVCTDLAGTGSTRRKPEPGMLLEAQRDLSIDLARSWFLGDSITDHQAGQAAGVRTILVGSFPPDAATIVVPTLADVPLGLFQTHS
ncbi:MAG: HAD family hydrolase [Bacteroidetes bacterium]|nr:HAD family hydrolase [Bacteroidota bacterium]